MSNKDKKSNKDKEAIMSYFQLTLNFRSWSNEKKKINGTLAPHTYSKEGCIKLTYFILEKGAMKINDDLAITTA